MKQVLYIDDLVSDEGLQENTHQPHQPEGAEGNQPHCISLKKEVRGKDRTVLTCFACICRLFVHRRIYN